MSQRTDASKREDFLWIVQTTFLANGINKAAQEKYREAHRHQYSGLGLKNEMCDVIKASYLIPDQLDAVEAAEQYLNWKLFSDGKPDQQQYFPSWVTPGFVDWDSR